MIKACNIRKARRGEASILSALAFESKAHWGYSMEFMQACRDELSVLEKHLRSKRFEYYVADIEKKIVGYYGLEKISLSEWELDALFVAPMHIRTGIGRLLIEHTKKLAAGKGAATILIQGDPNAEQFYHKAGAQLSGQKESKSIPGRFLPLFTISLQGV